MLPQAPTQGDNTGKPGDALRRRPRLLRAPSAGEHTDVAAHLEARGWEAARFGLTDLFAAAGLPELEEAAQQGPPAATIGFVRAVLK